MMSWSKERVGSICPERCGGLLYLAKNRFTDFLALVYAALTAKGENRILMTKIAKM